MSQLINVQLESYLLAQRAAPIQCLVCGHENCLSAERCCYCSAPIALARQALESKQKPTFIAVIGASGVGKTVYLGMLMDMLVRRVGGLRATLRGPMSIGLQQTTTTALASGWYPDKTSLDREQWNWVHCLVECSRRRKPVEIVLADIPGEAWAKESDRPGEFRSIPGVLSQAGAVIVLADAERLHAGDHNDDFVVHKVLSMMSELSSTGGRRPRRQNRRPLALIFSKSDACQSCADEPERFATSHASSLVSDCETRFPNTRVFAASAVGCSARRDVLGRHRTAPLRVEPQGIVEPLGWLMTQLA